MTSSSGPPSLLERARLEILQLKLDASDDLWRAFDSAMNVSASTLAVKRVGVWFMPASRTTLYRARVLDADHPNETGDMVLPLDGWPSYRDAVLSRRVIAADDARKDSRTSELHEYLDHFGIGSMLDVPLFLNGEVCGVICHEHVGAPRTWEPREIDFAVSVADMLSTLLEQSMRLSAERRLRAAEAAAARARELALAARAAAGIAHDVNTVLQAISLNAQAARADDPEARKRALQSILEDCQRSARILDQLRDLETPRTGQAAPIDIVAVLAAMRPTLEAIIGPNRTLAIITAEDAGWRRPRQRAGRARFRAVFLDERRRPRRARPLHRPRHERALGRHRVTRERAGPRRDVRGDLACRQRERRLGFGVTFLGNRAQLATQDADTDARRASSARRRSGLLADLQAILRHRGHEDAVAREHSRLIEPSRMAGPRTTRGLAAEMGRNRAQRRPAAAKSAFDREARYAAPLRAPAPSAVRRRRGRRDSFRSASYETADRRAAPASTWR